MASPEAAGPLAHYMLKTAHGSDVAYTDRLGDVSSERSHREEPAAGMPASQSNAGTRVPSGAGLRTEPSAQASAQLDQEGYVSRDRMGTEQQTESQVTGSDPAQKLRVVRVKRKRGESPVDSLWLETTSTVRAKRATVATLGSLSLDEASSGQSRQADVASRSLFRLVDTVTFSSLQEDHHALPSTILKKIREHQRRDIRKEAGRERQERLMAAAREGHQAAARRARYEQVRRSREGGAADQSGDAMSELFHLYDVVRVDDADEEERRQRAARREQAKRDAAQREGQLLCNFLPLLREYVPEAAQELEADLKSATPPAEALKGTEDAEFVYDVYYAPEGHLEEDDVPGLEACPTIQVVEDEDYDWREGPPPDFDSEDSNDENNPQNDYPDEESDEDLDNDLLDRVVKGALDWRSDDDEVNPYGSDKEDYETTAYDAEQDGSDSADDDDDEHGKMMWSRRK